MARSHRPPAGTTFAQFTPAGSTESQVVSLDFGTSTTQLGKPFNVFDRQQDGIAVGQLQGVTIDNDGIVRASFFQR